jgi:hypothetical protein
VQVWQEEDLGESNKVEVRDVHGEGKGGVRIDLQASGLGGPRRSRVVQGWTCRVVDGFLG